MSLVQTRRHRIVSLAIVTASLAVGTAIGVRLNAYGVPLALLTASALGGASSALWLLVRAEEALTTTTHRCTAPRCTITVRMRHTSATENRRWQEIAAAHPRHDDR